MSEPIPDRPDLEVLTRTQVLVAMGVTAVVLLIITSAWRYLGAVPLLSVKWQGLDLLLGVGLGLGITIVSGLAYRLWAAYRSSADFYLAMVLKPLFWFDLIWLGLLPGLSEELLFRGIMLPALGTNGVAVIVSSVCFGVLHLSSPRQWPYMVWATVIGLLLGYSALQTGNLLVPIAAHITTNLISGGIWKLENRQVLDS